MLRSLEDPGLTGVKPGQLSEDSVFEATGSAFTFGGGGGRGSPEGQLPESSSSSGLTAVSSCLTFFSFLFSFLSFFSFFTFFRASGAAILELELLDFEVVNVEVPKSPPIAL